MFHKRAETPIKRASVTMISWRSECLIAMYRSTFTIARCNNDAMHNNLKDDLEKPISTQYVPGAFPCSSTISKKIKRGRPTTPITASVEDKQARAILDLALTWFLVFTATMISTFKPAVIGHVMILMTVMKTSQQ